MSRLVLTSESLSRLQNELLAHEEESCAILFGRSIKVGNKLARLVIRESLIPPASAYAVRTRVRAQLRPEFVAEVTARARRNQNSIVFAHTHPFDGVSDFSSVDDAGEKELREFLRHRMPEPVHATLLVTPENSVARVLGQRTRIRVVGVGRRILWGEQSGPTRGRRRYDRQLRIFGRDGQAILKSIRVAIVGLGGTGTVVLQQLAHLGVHRFLLVDPDIVDETNLNRLIGANSKDVGKSKVSVAAAWVKRINPSAKIDNAKESVLLERSARLLLDSDFVFCCTDSEGSRAVLNQLAYQYLVPVIDMGVVIAAQKGRVANIAGRTQMLAPGLPCLTCANLLDAEQVRRDLLTDFERQADPYIVGDHEPAPAVVSLNSTIASLATTMFLNAATGMPGNARFVNYNAITGTVRSAICTPNPSCIVCSPRGAFARGNEWPLPARQN
jgi:molybdopterin/thiamine biosynthesis adenylyltransferase